MSRIQTVLRSGARRGTGCALFDGYGLRTFLVGLFLASCVLLHAQSPGAAAAFNQATQAMRQGKLEEAATGFAASLKLDPTFAEAEFNLGLVREEQGKQQEAIVSFRRALALRPHLHGANLFLGIAEFRLNHLENAEEAVTKESANYPKDSAAWMWLGVVRLARDRPEEAAEALDKAAKLRPDDQDILYHRGRAHLLVSKNSYAEMFKADPKSWRVHQVLAEADAEADQEPGDGGGRKRAAAPGLRA